jgi:hypothetical protein
MTPKTTTSIGFKESQYEPSVALDRPVLNGWIDTRDDARRGRHTATTTTTTTTTTRTMRTMRRPNAHHRV